MGRAQQPPEGSFAGLALSSFSDSLSDKHHLDEKFYSVMSSFDLI